MAKKMQALSVEQVGELVAKTIRGRKRPEMLEDAFKIWCRSLPRQMLSYGAGLRRPDALADVLGVIPCPRCGHNIYAWPGQRQTCQGCLEMVEWDGTGKPGAEWESKPAEGQAPLAQTF